MPATLHPMNPIAHRARWFLMFSLALSVARGQVTNVFNFDNGQMPAGTVFKGNNAGAGLTNAGGFSNSGCMVLTRPGSGQTYGQWVVTNDLAGGVSVSSFNV